ncbi:hypothetical protein NQ315_017349 [Exocentrus adspersus]|uniref:Tyr recombinase domain-containing protein n=1 Tax=Exocentrus adspersus TaxID=1586481 RepID=A0AAV8VKG2_9CUCU|nr:hypothetical protein NQ315_017349 [Exocentrus adspersus]
MSIRLPLNKIDKLQSEIHHMANRKQCKIRDFAKFVGQLVAAAPAVKYGWLYIKQFEREKQLHLSKNNFNYDATMLIHPKLKDDLNWWALNSKVSLQHFGPKTFHIEIYSDASTTGWGGFAMNQKTHGFWSTEESQLHINILEMKAAYYCLRSFTKDMENINILLRVDNITAISCINRMGSVRFPSLNAAARQIWQYCENKNIHVFASYIQSKSNIIADQQSRIQSTESEYELSKMAYTKGMSPTVAITYPGGRQVIGEAFKNKRTLPDSAIPTIIASLSEGTLKQSLQHASTKAAVCSYLGSPISIKLSGKFPPLASLSLEKLTWKLVTLMALTTASRAQTLSKIHANNITEYNDKIEIKISDRVKTSGPRKLQPNLVFPYFTVKPELCVASTIKFYLEKTVANRGNISNFLITYKKPYRPASSQTISRWIKITLRESGIDTNLFKSHSIRHATTSAAAEGGVSLDVIYKTAGWTEKSTTFAKFYNRPLAPDYCDFAKVLLSGKISKQQTPHNT